jgi:hypothetical protein
MRCGSELLNDITTLMLRDTKQQGRCEYEVARGRNIYLEKPLNVKR